MRPIKICSLEIFIVAMASISVSGQYRGIDERTISVSALKNPEEGYNTLFRLVDKNIFSMSHFISMEYFSFGKNGVGASMYTNSMRYNFTYSLSLRADVSFLLTQFGSRSSSRSSETANLFFNQMRLDYKPSNAFRMSFMVQHPRGSYPDQYYYNDLMIRERNEVLDH